MHCKSCNKEMAQLDYYWRTKHSIWEDLCPKCRRVSMQAAKELAGDAGKLEEFEDKGYLLAVKGVDSPNPIRWNLSKDAPTQGAYEESVCLKYYENTCYNDLIEYLSEHNGD